jgi:hypothetical protein
MSFLDDNSAKVLLKLISDTQESRLLWNRGRPQLAIISASLSGSYSTFGTSGYSGLNKDEVYHARDEEYLLVMSRHGSTPDFLLNTGSMTSQWGKERVPSLTRVELLELVMLNNETGVVDYTFPKDQLLVDLYGAIIAKNQGVEGYFKRKISGG